MKRRTGTILLLAIVVGPARGQMAEAPERKLEEAFYLEVAAADPEGAVQAYQKLLSEPSLPPRLAARAHLRLAICFRNLGRLDRAREHFETIADGYAAEADAVKIARRHLGQQSFDDPARYLPADVFFYAEAVEPGEHIRGLSDLLEGTPFQNPVDYYVSYLTQAAPGSPELPPGDAEGAEASTAAAFLNEGFLREVEKVEALAFAIPGPPRGKDDFLLLIDHGRSNILRGLVQMGLTLSKAQGVGQVRGTPIFRIPPLPRPPHDPAGPPPDPPAPLHMALGKEVILLGNPLRLVEEAIERFSTGAQSLADDPRFQAAQAARSGSLLFNYFGRESLWEAVRSGTSPAELPTFKTVESILGLEKIGPIHASLARTTASDTLRLSLHARLEGTATPAWRALATPALDEMILRAVPAGCLAFGATRWDDGLGRWRSARSAIEPLLASLPEESGAKAREAMAKVDGFFSEEAGRAFLEEIDALGLGITSDSRRPVEAAFLVLRFRQAARGEKVLEDALTTILGRVFDTRASRAFAPDSVAIGGREAPARSIEPVPGLKLRYAKVQDLFVVSLGEAPLRAAAGAASGTDAAQRVPLAPGASKVILLRPSALLEARGAEAPREAHVLLGKVERLIISTREGSDGLSVEVQVPEVTRTVRATLNRIAGELRRTR